MGLEGGKIPMAYPSVSYWAAHYGCAWANEQEPKLGGWDWGRIFEKAQAKDRELGKAAAEKTKRPSQTGRG